MDLTDAELRYLRGLLFEEFNRDSREPGYTDPKDVISRDELSAKVYAVGIDRNLWRF